MNLFSQFISFYNLVFFLSFSFLKIDHLCLQVYVKMKKIKNSYTLVLKKI